MKNKTKFKVGDKVRVREDIPYTIVYVDESDNTYLIQEGSNIWYDEKLLEPVDDEKPVITEHLIRGNKTIVKLSNGKVGVAKCSPEDKFDEYEGLRIATARAYGREIEEPKKEEPKEEKKAEPKFKQWDRVEHEEFGAGTIVEILKIGESDGHLPYLVLFDKSSPLLLDGFTGKFPSRYRFCKYGELKKIQEREENE